MKPRLAHDLRRWWWRAEDAVGDACVWLGNRDLALPALIVWTVAAVAAGAAFL